MASKSAPAARPALLTNEAKIAALPRLQKRVEELRAFDHRLVSRFGSPEVTKVRHAIDQALVAVFGPDTLEHRQYRGIAHIGRQRNVHDAEPDHLFEYQANVREDVEEAIAVLESIIVGFNEDIAVTHVPIMDASEPRKAAQAPNSKVFVVHGHDEAARESVARFLTELGLEPIILHEQASRSQTIIEKIEAHSDVGFAVVLLTGDDIGGKSASDLQPRARQNVIFELGYFIGRLKRARVCALRKGNVEVLSDFAGVVYTSMDANGAWKMNLAKEIVAAGIKVDSKALMM